MTTEIASPATNPPASPEPDLRPAPEWPPHSEITPAEAVRRAPHDLGALVRTPAALRFFMACQVGLSRLGKQAEQRFANLNRQSPEEAAALLLAALEAWDMSSGDIERTTQLIAGQLDELTDREHGPSGLEPPRVSPAEVISSVGVATTGCSKPPPTSEAVGALVPRSTREPPPTSAVPAAATDEDAKHHSGRPAHLGRRPAPAVVSSHSVPPTLAHLSVAAARPNETTPTALFVRPKIDPEFKALMYPMALEARELLKQKLRTEGCREKLVAALIDGELLLLDGHHRAELCDELGIDFEFVVEKSVTTRAAAIEWIIRHQLSRRNLPGAATAYYRGYLYHLTKGHRGGAHSPTRCDTGLALAKRFGVHPRTVEQDARFASQLDHLVETHGEPVRLAVLGPEPTITRKDVERISQLDPPSRARAVEQILDQGKSPSEVVPARQPATKKAKPRGASATSAGTIDAPGPAEVAEQVAKLVRLVAELRELLSGRLEDVLAGNAASPEQARMEVHTWDGLLGRVQDELERLAQLIHLPASVASLTGQVNEIIARIPVAMAESGTSAREQEE